MEKNLRRALVQLGLLDRQGNELNPATTLDEKSRAIIHAIGIEFNEKAEDSDDKWVRPAKTLMAIANELEALLAKGGDRELDLSGIAALLGADRTHVDGQYGNVRRLIGDLTTEVRRLTDAIDTLPKAA